MTCPSEKPAIIVNVNELKVQEAEVADGLCIVSKFLSHKPIIVYATRVGAGNQSSYSLKYVAYLRLTADRTDSALPWVVRRGRSYGFI
jgi:hypothetical protein